MKCPYLVETIIETNNKNTFCDSKRVEHKTFAECVKSECPFYNEQGKQHRCKRVLAETVNLLPIE